jgi:hypothetical protein
MGKWLKPQMYTGICMIIIMIMIMIIIIIIIIMCRYIMKQTGSKQDQQGGKDIVMFAEVMLRSGLCTMKLPLECAADVAALAECVKALNQCLIKHPYRTPMHGKNNHNSNSANHDNNNNNDTGDQYIRLYSDHDVALLAHVAHHLWEPLRIRLFTRELICPGQEAYDHAVQNLLQRRRMQPEKIVYAE